MGHRISCWKRSVFLMMSATAITVILYYYDYAKIPIKIEHKRLGPIENKNIHELTSGNQIAVDLEAAKEHQDDSVIKEPQGDSITKEHQRDSITKETQGDSIIKEPQDVSIIKEPQGDSIIKEPQGDDSITKEPQGDSIVKEPQDESIIKEPLDESIIKKPQGDSIVKEPQGDSIVKEPQGDSIVKEPQGDSIVKEPEGDSIVKEPQGDSIVKELQDVPMVLLITYLRSGSTLLGEIVQQVQTNAVYVFEPLKHYLPRHYYISRDRGMCYTTDDRCSHPSTNHYQLIMEEVKRFYRCDLRALKPSFFQQPKTSTMYNTCRMEADRERCFNLIPSCKPAVKIAKFIRLSMDVVQELLEDFSNLKVIHLLRDPRGMIVSRRRSISHLHYTDMSSVARAVCNRYNREIGIGQSLKVKYPNRIKTVLYEQITERPLETSSRVFEFLGLQPNSNFKTWLKEHIAGDPNRPDLGNPGFSTVKANSTATANSWRSLIKLSDVMKIDRMCSQVYEYTGYLAVHSSNHLHNLNIALRKKNIEFP